MAEETPMERLRANVSGVVTMLVTGIWMAALFTGQEWWLPALIVGYVVVVPLTGILAGDDDEEAWVDEADDHRAETTTETETADALETLRDRYARGELSDEQFERKLERLLETETPEDAAEHVRSRPSVRREDADEGAETERERNLSEE